MIITKKTAIVKTQPITTGKSILFKESTTSFPIPFQPKIYSTKTAPDNKLANHPEIAVMTGFIEFLRTCLDNVFLKLKPLAIAVLT